MTTPAPFDDTLSDLLVKLACEGLSEAEQAQLEGYRSASPAQAAAVEAQLLSYEQAAAAVALSAPGREQPMPAELRSRVENQARAFFASAAVIPLRGDSRGPASSWTPAAGDAPRAVAPRAGGAYGWWAAAAALLLAFFLTTRTAHTPATVSIAAQRAALLAHADTLKLDWKASPTEPAAAEVHGDVVWDSKTNTGYMRFVGLAKNDAAQQQYQLWIFDAARDARYPVDGGVFDVPGGNRDVVIPIRAALPVAQLKLFAVTLEKAGGVVVSAREHIVVSAQPG